MAVSVGRQVILAWTECGSDGLGFRIERATGAEPGRPFVDVGGVGPHVAAFRDESVKPGTAYAYRVHAWNATGVTSPSNVAEVTTPQTDTEASPDPG